MWAPCQRHRPCIARRIERPELPPAAHGSCVRLSECLHNGQTPAETRGRLHQEGPKEESLEKREMRANMVQNERLRGVNRGRHDKVRSNEQITSKPGLLDTDI